MAEWRKLICGVLVVILPTYLTAESPGRALLHHNGGVWLNGNVAPESSAIFPDAYIQTQKDSSATLDADGSTVLIGPETIVQYEGNELVLDHGSLQLNSARQMRVRVNCILVIPVRTDRTQYDVSDIDGKVKVVARQLDVNINYEGTAARKSKRTESSSATVREGEWATREERCGAAIMPEQVVDATGPILSRPVLVGGALVVAGITCWALCLQGGTPVSPSKP